jgi:hypothetical protein
MRSSLLLALVKVYGICSLLFFLGSRMSNYTTVDKFQVQVYDVMQKQKKERPRINNDVDDNYPKRVEIFDDD